MKSSFHFVFKRATLAEATRTVQAIGGTIRSRTLPNSGGWQLTITYPQTTLPALLAARKAVRDAINESEN